MIPRLLRWSGIAVMVLAVYAGIQMFAYLCVAYYFRFRTVTVPNFNGVDGPLHHWRWSDTLNSVALLVFYGLLFAVGFYLRRAGTPPSPNNALQRTGIGGGASSDLDA